MEKNYNKDFVLDKEIKGVILAKDFVEKKPLIIKEIERFVLEVIAPQIYNKIPNKSAEEKHTVYEREGHLAVEISPQDIFVYVHYTTNNKGMIFELSFTHFFDDALINGDYSRPFVVKNKGSLENNLIELNKKMKHYLMEFMY
jgi:hypothetical protein